jgi:SAM-dependent methyltransferase
MLDIMKQVDRGVLICPASGQKLVAGPSGETLVTADGSRSYPLLGGRVPILLADPDALAGYATASTKMNDEYNADKHPFNLNVMLNKVQKLLLSDYRKNSSIKAVARIFDNQSEDGLCLSIGGGPDRDHPCLINLNIGPFPNVELVADAHQLPYADNCVDAIYSNAVFEHLGNPSQAAAEMFRVLKPGGEIFVSTPFLQAYHGYPYHFQNFTLTGHEHLFRSQGFEITESGACVGLVYTFFNLTSKFMRYFLPTIIGLPLLVVWNLLSLPFRPIDKLLNEHPNAHMLASTTYLVARKP